MDIKRTTNDSPENEGTANAGSESSVFSKRKGASPTKKVKVKKPVASNQVNEHRMGVQVATAKRHKKPKFSDNHVRFTGYLRTDIDKILRELCARGEIASLTRGINEAVELMLSHKFGIKFQQNN